MTTRRNSRPCERSQDRGVEAFGRCGSRGLSRDNFQFVGRSEWNISESVCRANRLGRYGRRRLAITAASAEFELLAPRGRGRFGGGRRLPVRRTDAWRRGPGAVGRTAGWPARGAPSDIAPGPPRLEVARRSLVGGGGREIASRAQPQTEVVDGGVAAQRVMAPTLRPRSSQASACVGEDVDAERGRPRRPCKRDKVVRAARGADGLPARLGCRSAGLPVVSPEPDRPPRNLGLARHVSCPRWLQ